MKRSNRGRPTRKENRHIVWLSTSTFKIWKERKIALGFKNSTHSEFAEALLHGKALQGVAEWSAKTSRSIGEGDLRKRARSSAAISVSALFHVSSVEIIVDTNNC